MDLKTFTNLPFYIKLACVLFSLFAIGYLAILGKEILSPLIFSCLFSILLLPLASFLERKLRLPRSAACMIAVLLFLSVIGLLLYVIGSQITDLAKDWPQFQSQLSKSADDLQAWVSATFHVNESKQLTYVKKETTKIMSSGTAVVGTTLLSLSSILLFLVFYVHLHFFLFALSPPDNEVFGVGVFR